MAKFLDTTGVSYHLTQLIKDAREKVILVSPFLKLNERLKEFLSDKDKLRMDIKIIFGKNELHPDESNWLLGVKSVRLLFCKNLHAKCYLNEREAIVTSMNLYEFSQVNNNEMGILVSKDQDPELYAAIHEEVLRLVRTSDEVQISVQRVKPSEAQPAPAITSRGSRTRDTEQGHCISCGDSVKLNPMAPYCRNCYTSWSKQKDEDRKENHCHVCGKDHGATKAKPSCYPCYKEHKTKLEFPLQNLPF